MLKNRAAPISSQSNTVFCVTIDAVDMSGTTEMTAAFEEFQFRVALAVTQWESLNEKYGEYCAWIQEAKERLVLAREEPEIIKIGGDRLLRR